MKNFREMTNVEIEKMKKEEINEVLDQMLVENEQGLKKWGITENTEKRIRSFWEKEEKYNQKRKEEILTSIFSVGAQIFISNESILELEIDDETKMQRVNCEFGEVEYLLKTNKVEYRITEDAIFGLWSGWSVTKK